MRLSPKSTSDQDTQLLLHARGGDGRAFEKLYISLRPAVGNYVQSLDGQFCPHERDDIVQEAFLRAWRGLSNCQGYSSAKTYLFGIARNVLRERFRQRQQRAALLEALQRQAKQNWHQAPSTPVAAELEEKLAQVLTQMPLPQRDAIHMVLIERISPSSAAQRAGCSRDAMYKRLRKATRRLAEALRAQR